jgi:hypothetical protein
MVGVRFSRRALVTALVVYSALLAVALLAPSSGHQSSLAAHVRDLGTWVGFSPELATQARAEFLCNALILAPVPALGSLVWLRTGWRDWVAGVFVVAGCIEVVQGLFLPQRTASYEDVVANTLGALGGAVAGAVARRVPWLQARPPRDQPPANGGRNSTDDPGSMV